MTPYCDYHPTDAAKWTCPGCFHQYCPGCMPDADPTRQRGACPHCGQSLKYLGAAGQVEPFWTRTGAFFRYPLRPAPLTLIALCTFVPALLSGNLLGALVSLFLLVVLFKYTYSIIQHTADGNLDPPGLASAFTGAGFGIIFRQLGVFFLMGGLITAAALVGGGFLALLAAGFLILALPASVIVLAMEERMLPAISPVHLAALIARIGWPYFILYAHLILMSLSATALQDFALSHLSPWLGQLLAGLVGSYFTLIFFHMLGYLLFQYQGQLGFASDYQEDAAGPATSDRSKRLEADIDMALKDGHYDKLQTLLLEALKRYPRHNGYTEKLYRLLEARQDSAGLLKHHNRILPWMLERGEAEALGHCLLRLKEIEPAFELAEAKLGHECARLLHQHGKHQQALQLLRDFHKRHPDYDQLAEAYLLAAKILANDLGRHDKAVLFLRYIQQKCAGQPVHASVGHYLAQASSRQPLSAPGGSLSEATPAAEFP